MPRHLAAAALALALTLAGLPAIAQDQVGINTHVPGADLLDLCVDAGVSWVRMDGDWLSLNPAAGRYDWAALDAAVNAARSRGLRVYLTLAYTPAWVPRVARTRADAYPGNDEPASSAQWTTFVTEAVRHYRPLGVTHFGIWNEPNLNGFWEEAAGLDPYVTKILVPGAAAVRAACADCRVLGPDLAHVGEYNVFLDGVLARARGSFDILAHHIYSGWPETGTTLLSGDSFVQALEMRRFPFTRASLREVLDARGWTGEVWITETGYRATPVGDAAAEGRQATSVRRTLEEQLARRWWSNTFFYEVMDCGVDQAMCDIDGFGLSRALRPITGGPRRYPADYRVKPAFTALRDFIRAHPEVVSRAMPAQCANGVDDDGDRRVDGDDRGCASGLDTNEADDPPRLRVDALAVAAGAVRVDGALDEWSDAGWVTLPRASWVGGVPLLVSGDLGVRLAARWSPGTLYLAAEVTDERHANDRSDDTLWAGDSLQVAFDVARNLGDRYDATDDHELTVALARGATRVNRFHGPPGAALPPSVVVRREGNVTRYELALPMASLTPASLSLGTVLGWSFLVNDNDGATTPEGNGREGWMEWTSGIGLRKDPYRFGELHLVGEAPVAPLDAAAPPDATASPDAAPAVDAPVGMDAPAARDVAVARDALADVARDGSADAVTYDVPDRPGDCACGASPGRREGFGLIALAALLTARRRRVRPRPW